MDRELHTDGELIDLIYAALLGEASWQTFLDRLSRDLPNGKAAFFYHDARSQRGAGALMAGIDDAMAAAYAEHYSSCNVWMPQAMLRPAGVAVIDAELFPRDQLAGTEYYNDFLRPNGLASSSGLIVDKADDGFTFMLTTLSGETDMDVNRWSADRLARLAPHLKRASNFYRRTAVARIATGFASFLDAVGMGLVIVGDGFRVKAISSAGQAILQEGVSAAISPLGRLRLRSPDAQAVLSGMLERGYEGAKVVNLPGQGARITLVHMTKDRISLFFEGPTVIVLMEPARANAPAVDIEAFSRRFGLSRAQVRVVSGIVDGKTIGQIAAHAGVSRETIRTQLKSVYARTGVSSQTDLLRLVHSLRQ